MLGPLEVRTGADPGQAVEVTGAQLRALAKVVRLRAALAGQRALLVLDNCEHLVAAAATLAVNSSRSPAGPPPRAAPATSPSCTRTGR